MKKATSDDMLPEYDFSHGVRGKYAARLAKGSNVVVLDKDVATLFPDSASVNAALRALGMAISVASPAKAKATATKSSGSTGRRRAA
jgi:hypothetical protein